MKFFNVGASIALALFLQGCGSSSSPAPVEPEPTEKTFTLTSTIENSCGVISPFTDVDVFLQDENWETLDKYSPDENGVVTFTTFDETINYTVVAKTKIGIAPESYDINSFIQAETTNPVTYQAQHDGNLDETGCECITRDVLVEHQPFSLITEMHSSAKNHDAPLEVDSESTLFANVDVCRIVDGEWPVTSFSIIGLNLASPALKTGSALFLSDFDAGNDAQMSEFARYTTSEFDLPPSHQDFSHNSWIQSAKHLSQDIKATDEEIVLFDSHKYINENLYQSKANFIFEDDDSFYGALLIESTHEKVSSVLSTSFNVAASIIRPDIDEERFTDISADGSYDYSAVTGYPLAIISSNYSKESGTLINFSWTTHGPAKGLLPVSVTTNDGTTVKSPTSVKLIGYETLMDNTRLVSTDTWLLKSVMGNDYNDYISYAQNEKTSSDDVNHLANDLHTYHIKIIN